MAGSWTHRHRKTDKMKGQLKEGGDRKGQCGGEEENKWHECVGGKKIGEQRRKRGGWCGERGS